MTDLAYAAPRLAAPAPAARALQHGVLWLLGASGAIVFIEPSPYEFAILIALVLFGLTGLRLAPAVLGLAAMLAGIEFGYTIGAIDLLDDSTIVFWLVTSWYMAFTAILFACIILDDTHARVDALARGYLAGALVAALAGIAGYFHLVPGGDDLLTYAGRARGTFKDPNVLGAYLVFPALLALQRVIEAPFWRALRNGAAFGVIALAIFLAFSRAAWGTFAGSAALMAALMFLTAPTQQQRLRIILLTLAAALLAVVALALLLSVDAVAALFKERASFSQPYDSGRFGRFGRHILGFEMALDYPLGIGPLQFRRFFPEDTHNSFLNAFMSGGWISGVLYPAFVLTTALYGLKTVLLRTPWQRLHIAVLSTLLVTILESFIIDTDHWRHYFMLVGLTWGLAIAGAAWRRNLEAGLHG